HGRHIGPFDPQDARHKHVTRDHDGEIGRRIIRAQAAERCVAAFASFGHAQIASEKPALAADWAKPLQPTQQPVLRAGRLIGQGRWRAVRFPTHLSSNSAHAGMGRVAAQR
ncbi:MAG: hypothetical protein RL724_563, partial [Pseudomonadota bacterium]